jgi:hypothetical protein
MSDTRFLNRAFFGQCLDPSRIECQRSRAFESRSVPFACRGLHCWRIRQPEHIAIDPYGHVWVINNGPGVSPPGIAELSQSGVALSPSVGFTSGGLSALSTAIAVDGSGDPWVVDVGSGELTEFSNSGVDFLPRLGSAAAD